MSSWICVYYMSLGFFMLLFFFFFKQKTAYEMRISDWSSDVCSSDLGSVQLWRIRVQRPLALPVIEEARGPFLLLRRLAPISCRQASILPPRAARDRKSVV